VVRDLLHGVRQMQKVPGIEVLGEVAHHLLDKRRDPRLLLMDRRAEDRCSSPRDEDHHRGSDARHERLERPHRWSAEHGLEQQYQHALSVGRDADRSRQSEPTSSDPGMYIARIACPARAMIGRVLGRPAIRRTYVRMRTIRAWLETNGDG